MSGTLNEAYTTTGTGSRAENLHKIDPKSNTELDTLDKNGYNQQHVINNVRAGAIDICFVLIIAQIEYIYR